MRTGCLSLLNAQNNVGNNRVGTGDGKKNNHHKKGNTLEINAMFGCIVMHHFHTP